MKAHRPDRPSSVVFLPSATLAGADDTTLVQGLCAGDPRATREAWHRFGPMVHRLLLRTLGPETELEDLSQEVFITFFDRVKTLRDPRTVTAFLMSITAFKIRYYLRWRWLRRWLFLPGRSEPTDLRSVEQAPEAREALLRFFKVLDHLNPVDRTAFTLRFVEELELREVAAAIDLSLATTKRRLTRAWKRVARLVERDPALEHFLRQSKNAGQFASDASETSDDGPRTKGTQR
jgi:RNA polymerase sigma-70 factor (ECF subfamily)